MVDDTGNEAVKGLDGDVEHFESDVKQTIEDTIHHPDPQLYAEALRRYPNDEAIDQAEEKRLVRKLDMRILPLLGICYFFYVRGCVPSVLGSPVLPIESSGICRGLLVSWSQLIRRVIRLCTGLTSGRVESVCR